MILKGLRVVEGSSFVAAPSCGLHLAQLGAEVIRFDMISGGPDFRRWPQSREGRSFFWEGLNKGKKSIAIDLRQGEGRELAVRLITAPGANAGIFVTNFPADGFLAHKRLAERRADLISVRIMGHADGRSAVDYTVNAATGLPYMTGPASLGEQPVNHVLPAWDLLAGSHAAFSVLAAERARRDSGVGQEVRIALADLAASTLGHLGQIAEVMETGESRSRHGNALYGAFGRDFSTADGKRVMIVAITEGQWRSLVAALDIAGDVAALEQQQSVSFTVDEGLRFIYREQLFAIVQARVEKLDLAGLGKIFEKHGVCWSQYLSLGEALRDDADFSVRNPLFQDVGHPSGRTYPTPGPAAIYSGFDRPTPSSAPRLGENTEEILADLLSMSEQEIADLHDRSIVASA